eukprot:NODE_414_length_2795_cov_23.818114_g355_i0.p1 GENE.NODE_414_length_2795_cov_23.818114_g355_i0~~NODE_414_length_2795_cov_23.818114_g355_i0.p1  ORF type:complete len:809 (+),score=132.24 NODE_414_length_2795_cov_23.818114_g355_i0:314-2428(+)
MISVRSTNVREKWQQVMLEATKYFNVEILQDEVIKVAVQKGEPSEPPDSRQFCCEMFGALACRLDSSSIEKLLLSKVIWLCQDTDYTVRMSMCAQLNSVARAVGLIKTKELISKELFELLGDEEAEVARVALTALVDMLSFFDQTYRKEHILPILRRYVAKPPKQLHQLLLSLFGRYLFELSEDIDSDEDTRLFCTFFKSAAYRTYQDSQSTQWRELCAFNFPAVIKSIGVKKYSIYLSSTYKALCEDSSTETRKKMASGFHEVCSIFGEKAMHHLKDCFLSLLQDSDLEVQYTIMCNLSTILQTFNDPSIPELERNELMIQCVAPISQYEASVRHTWRKVSSLLKHFHCFPVIFPSEVLHDKFIPILFHHLERGAAVIKGDCARLLMLFTRHLNNNHLQVEIFNRLLSEFGQSPSYWHRQTFVLVCMQFISHFSRKLFREKMLEVCLALAEDPVPNVRASLASIMPQIKRTLKPPAPIELMSTFTERLAWLAVDVDADVREAARIAESQIEDSHMRRRVDEEEELIDRQREHEENTLLEVAQEQEKQRRRQALRDMIAEQDKSILPSGVHHSHSAPTGSKTRQTGSTLTKTSSNLGRMNIGPSAKVGRPNSHERLQPYRKPIGKVSPLPSTDRINDSTKLPDQLPHRRSGSAGTHPRTRQDGPYISADDTRKRSPSSMPTVLPTLQVPSNPRGSNTKRMPLTH